MIIDSSAIIAILFNESDAAVYAAAIASAAQSCRISATNYVEAAVVVGVAKPRGRRSPVRHVHAPCRHRQLLARQAYADFGKGRHPAGLNFGDCFSYALAKASGEPLLFKGNDFSRTGVQGVRHAD